MDKVLVEVYCPINNKNYDVYIPKTLVVYDVKILLAKLIENVSNSQYFYENQVLLCDYESGKIIGDNLTFDELNIKNGYKLLLI